MNTESKEALISNLHEIEKVIGRFKCGCYHIAANHDKDGCSQCQCASVSNDDYTVINLKVMDSLEIIKKD